MSDARIDWQYEHDRFAHEHPRIVRYAGYVFRRWSESKHDDAIQDVCAKVWSTWRNLVLRGKDPLEIGTYRLTYFAIRSVQVGSRIHGTRRGPGGDFLGYTPHHGRAPGEVLEAVAATAPDPIDADTREESWAAWLTTQDDLTRAVLSRFADGATITAISASLGVSVPRINKVRRAARDSWANIGAE